MSALDFKIFPLESIEVQTISSPSSIDPAGSKYRKTAWDAEHLISAPSSSSSSSSSSSFSTTTSGSSAFPRFIVELSQSDNLSQPSVGSARLKACFFSYFFKVSDSDNNSLEKSSDLAHLIVNKETYALIRSLSNESMINRKYIYLSISKRRAMMKEIIDQFDSFTKSKENGRGEIEKKLKADNIDNTLKEILYKKEQKMTVILKYKADSLNSDIKSLRNSSDSYLESMDSNKFIEIYNNYAKRIDNCFSEHQEQYARIMKNADRMTEVTVRHLKQQRRICLIGGVFVIAFVVSIVALTVTRVIH